MEESVFIKVQYDEAFSFLKKGLPDRLEKVDPQYDSNVWISYVNSLKIIEGYVLRQAALFEIGRTGTKGPAVKEFCSYLSTAYWVD